MTKNEAMKLALEALEWSWGGEPLGTKEVEAMSALRQALDQPERSLTSLTADDQQYIEVERAEAYAQARVNEALDKAADLVGGSSMTSRHAAAAIRALKEQP